MRSENVNGTDVLTLTLTLRQKHGVMRLNANLLAFACSHASRALGFGSPIITGALCDQYKMNTVSKTMAYNYVSKLEDDAVKKRLPSFVAREMAEAKHLFTSSCAHEMLVTFIQEEGCLEPDYVVLYRKTASTPTIYTVDALIVHGDKDVQMSIQAVERILQNFCYENRGFLQMHPLKMWSGGRYAKAMLLERVVSDE